MRLLFSHLALFLFLGACATGHRSTSVEMRKFVAAGQYDEAIQYLKQSPLAQDEKSKLLLHIELGLIEHYKGNFEASSVELTHAKALIDELYTTRISGKVESALSNDNADFYYGEKYEASLVYFYLSLNSYMQGIKEVDPTKRKTHLLRARAEIVDWDSFLTEMKHDRMGKTVFKEDLLAKVFGGLVHESQGTHNDNQIALQLYKDAKTLFFRNYNLYPSFNASFESFRKNFDVLHTLKTQEIEKNYVQITPHSQDFTAFLDHKIKELETRMKKGKKTNESTISFLVQDGLIAEKAPNVHEIPIAYGMHHGAAMSFGLGQHVTFELPTVVGVEKLEVAKIQAVNEQGLLVKEVHLPVVAPLGELAKQAIDEHSTAIAAKTATRVVAKHIAALVASSAAMQSARRNNNSMGTLLAMAGHAAAVAAINHSEKADVRYWSTLPSSIRMGQMSLPAGTYKFQAVYDSGTSVRVVDLGVNTIHKTQNHFVMDSRDRQYRPYNPTNSVVQGRTLSGTKPAH